MRGVDDSLALCRLLLQDQWTTCSAVKHNSYVIVFVSSLACTASPPSLTPPSEAANLRHCPEALWFLFWVCCHSHAFTALASGEGGGGGQPEANAPGGAVLRDWRVRCRNVYQVGSVCREDQGIWSVSWHTCITKYWFHAVVPSV